MTMLGEQSAEQVIEHLAELAEGDVLSRVVVSAQIGADGRLSRVGGIDAKLGALFGDSPFVVRARTGQFPPRAVGIAQDQTELLTDAEIDAHRKAHALPQLCFQETFAGLVADLRVQQSLRPGVAPFRFADELSREKYDVALFEGREWLFKRIEDLVASHDRGLIVLKAGAGFGKTAFVLKLIETYGGQLLGRAWVLAWHVFRRNQSGWLPTPALAGQIEYQLRDRLLMPLSEGRSEVITPQNAPTVLKQVLEEAAKKLEAAPERKLLIVVDGLDEAFGANTPVEQRGQMTYLQRLFPQKLPPGVFILLTSRPGDHLRALGDPDDLFVLDSEADAAIDQANRQDLGKYLSRRITEYGEAQTAYPSEIQSLVERMVEASQGAFFVAEWFARKETLDRKDDPAGPTNFERWCKAEAKLPRGIDEMLKKDWDHKANILQDEKWGEYLPVLATALALWHQQGTHPTRQVITDLIESARASARQRDSTVPLSVGTLDTEDIKTAGIEACLEQLRDWCVESGSKERRYVFRHSRIPELILAVLAKTAGDEAIQQKVHALLAWSCGRWRQLKGDSRTAALRGLPQHLLALAANDIEAAKKLADMLIDYQYLVAALGADPKDPARPLPIHDLAEYARQAAPLMSPADPSTAEAITLLADALTLSIPALSRDPTALPSQLRGRLGELSNERLAPLTQKVDDGTHWQWLRPVRASLTSPGGAEVRRMQGHTNSVTHVALHADGRRAVSASWDRTLRVWDLERGTCVATLKGHTRSVTHVALHADGRRAVSASDDKTLRVWDLERGTCLATLQGHTGNVTHVALHADGRRAMSASDDKTLRVWDLERGTCLATLQGHTGNVTHVALHADGRRAVSASEDKTLRVWDLERGTCVATLEGHTGRVTHVALHADGRRAVSASDDGTLRVWDPERGTCLATLEGHTGNVTHVALHADGRRAVSASWNRTLRVWDLERGTCVATLEGHTGRVTHVALHADGRRAVSASWDDTLRVWDLDRGTSVATPEGHKDAVDHVVLHADGWRAVSASWDRTLRVWDLERGTCVATLEGHTGRVTHVVLHADGRRAVSASDDGTLRVWDLKRGTCLATLEGHTFKVTHVALHADGRRAVSASWNRTLRVWDLERGTCVAVLEGHTREVTHVALHADGRRAVSGSDDGTLRVWDLERGTCLAALEGHTGRVTHVALHADGRRAVSASWDRTLRVWDLERGTCVAVLEGHTQGVAHVALHADGRRAVSASWDRTLRVWDLERGTCVAAKEGHTGGVLHVALHADGRQAVSGSTDWTVRVWDLDAGKATHLFMADGAFNACEFVPDREMIVAGDAAGQVHFLRMINRQFRCRFQKGPAGDVLRPGDHRQALGDPADLLVLDSEADVAFDQANRQDLREYLTRRITEYVEAQTAYPSEIKSLVERMVEACQGAFYVAEWFTRKETLDRKEDPAGPTNYERWCELDAKLPRGIDEMLRTDWTHKYNILQSEKYGAYLPVMATALALWHQHGTQPTRRIVDQLIEKARDAARQRDPTVPPRVGKLDTEDIKRAGLDACLEQLRDWCVESGVTSERRYVFRHSRIPELILKVLATSAGDEAIQQEVHALLAWSNARWRELKGDSRTAALRGLPQHLLALAAEGIEAAEQLADTLLDYEYLVAALGADPKDAARPLPITDLAEYAIQAAALTPRSEPATAEGMALWARLFHRILGRRGAEPPVRDAIDLLADALLLSVAALSRDPSLLPSQLWGRLAELSNERLATLAKQLDERTHWAWLRPAWGSLTPAGGAGSRRLLGHTGRVVHVALHADGRRAVSASEDKTLRVWDLERGTCVATLEGHTGRVTHVVLHADGRRAVSASEDKTLRVWDLERGPCVATLAGHTDGVTHMALHADGRRAVSASRDRTLRVWDLEGGTCLAVLAGHTDKVTHVALHADGRRAVSASEDKSLRVWDLERGTCLAMLEGHNSAITHVVLHTDGRRAVSASVNGTLCIWDLERGTCLATLAEHTNFVRDLVLLADGRRVVSSSEDGTLRVWQLEGGACLATLMDQTWFLNCLDLHSGGRRVLSASSNLVRLWDLATEDITHVYSAEANITTCDFMYDRGMVVAGDADGFVHFLKVKEALSDLNGSVQEVDDGNTWKTVKEKQLEILNLDPMHRELFSEPEFRRIILDDDGLRKALLQEAIIARKDTS